MSKRKPIAITAKNEAAPGAAHRAAVTPGTGKRIKVFMYVRLNGLVRVCLEHASLDRAKEVAASLCFEIEERLGLADLERLSCDFIEEDGEEIDLVELVEVTQNHGMDLQEPEFYALKADGVFVEGGDPDLLPPKYR